MHPFYGSHLPIFHKLKNGEITGVAYATEPAVDYFNLLNSQNGLLRTTKDRLILQSNVFYFRQYSWTAAIDTELHLYSQHGLTCHWMQKYKSNTDDAFSGELQTPKVLMLHSVLGGFIILATMLVISCIVLFLELLAVKFNFIRRVIEFFTY